LNGCLLTGCFWQSSITFHLHQIDGVVAKVLSEATVYPLRIASDIVPLGDHDWEVISGLQANVRSDGVGGSRRPTFVFK
jgi:hypothetical protein